MIVFRVDANEQVATGHLMRCLAIAEECRRQGENCLFLLAEEKETDRIVERGFPFHVLHTRWDDLEGEMERLQDYLEKNPCKWLVVDSYQATPAYLQRLNVICPVLYLDDFGQNTYPVAAVLHYGVVREIEDYIHRYRSKGVAVLAGAEYIPLREEFQPAHLAELERQQGDRQSDMDLSSILITTGGTDPYHVTEQILQYCLTDSIFAHCCYHVIVGGMNGHVQELRQLAEQYTKGEFSPVILHTGVNNMAELMCQCNFAVSAGGTTLYELCACGIPTVCFSFSDNQLPTVRLLQQQRIMHYAGDAREGEVGVEIGKYLAKYMGDPEETAGYQNRMKGLVDGKGVWRITHFLCQNLLEA